MGKVNQAVTPPLPIVTIPASPASACPTRTNNIFSRCEGFNGQKPCAQNSNRTDSYCACIEPMTDSPHHNMDGIAHQETNPNRQSAATSYTQNHGANGSMQCCTYHRNKSRNSPFNRVEASLKELPIDHSYVCVNMKLVSDAFYGADMEFASPICNRVDFDKVKHYRAADLANTFTLLGYISKRMSLFHPGIYCQLSLNF